MSITSQAELLGMQQAAQAVAQTLRAMKAFAQPGMSTWELDQYGAEMLRAFGARPAPKLAYGFPGTACISVNEEFCHGIAHPKRILQEGDLINIDVSAELNGFWADNGCSFVLGADIHGHQALVDASKAILAKALKSLRSGMKIADLGGLMEQEAKRQGYVVVKDLGGHGIGRQLHEQPDALLNYRNRFDQRRFRKNTVVAIETFIATRSTSTRTLADGWTLVGNRGGYMAQHEHTVVVTDGAPLILTAGNGVFD